MAAINFEALSILGGVGENDQITNAEKIIFVGGENTIVKLPWSKDLEELDGVTLKGNNCGFGDLEWIIDTSKVIVTDYFFDIEEKEEHECVNHGQCSRCSENTVTHNHLIRISGIKSKKSINFLQWSYDQLGSVYGNMYRV